MIGGLRRRMLNFLFARGIIDSLSGDKWKNAVLRTLTAEAIGLSLPKNRTAADRLLSKYVPAGPASKAKPQTGSPPWSDVPAAPVISFYDTDEWRTLRYKALKLHGGCCQCCGNRASRGKPLHVDHIKPRSKYPKLELDLNNLQVLCKDCNLGKRAWDQTDWRPEARA